MIDLRPVIRSKYFEPYVLRINSTHTSIFSNAMLPWGIVFDPNTEDTDFGHGLIIGFKSSVPTSLISITTREMDQPITVIYGQNCPKSDRPNCQKCLQIAKEIDMDKAIGLVRLEYEFKL